MTVPEDVHQDLIENTAQPVREALDEAIALLSLEDALAVIETHLDYVRAVHAGLVDDMHNYLGG